MKKNPTNFELYQFFIHTFLSQKVSIPPNQILTTHITRIFTTSNQILYTNFYYQSHHLVGYLTLLANNDFSKDICGQNLPSFFIMHVINVTTFFKEILFDSFKIRSIIKFSMRVIF